MCSNAPDRLRHVPRHGSGKSLIAFKTQHPRMTRSETLVRCCECVLRHSQRSGPFSLSRSLESVQKGSECSLGISPCALAGLGYITRTNGTMFESSFSARERERERAPAWRATRKTQRGWARARRTRKLVCSGPFVVRDQMHGSGLQTPPPGGGAEFEVKAAGVLPLARFESTSFIRGKNVMSSRPERRTAPASARLARARPAL